jgi:hypothetical protein
MREECTQHNDEIERDREFMKVCLIYFEELVKGFCQTALQYI